MADADKISVAKAKAARIKDVERMASQGKIGIREAMNLIQKIDPSLYPDPKKKNTGGSIELGLSPAEKRDNKQKQTRQKESPSTKIKGERSKDLARLEKIKENQKKADLAKKEKQKKSSLKFKGIGGSREKGQPIKIQEQLLVKRDALKKNMGGAIMKNRGGMFKGSY
tara:strand:- start:359 stop:862 length:504 start_codon:yes stop_codon:yes gene_type:complete